MSTIDPFPPSAPPPAPPTSNARGSLGAGVGFAWAVVVGGHIVLLTLAAGAGRLMSGEGVVGILVLPWIAVIALSMTIMSVAPEASSSSVPINSGGIAQLSRFKPGRPVAAAWKPGSM